MSTLPPDTDVMDLPAVTDDQRIGQIMMNAPLLQEAMKMAEVMAAAKVTVPKHLQGNTGDCYAIVLQSLQWRMSPFVVAQKTHLVNGTLGYEAQLANAVLQASGAVKSRPHYEYQGEGNNLQCRVAFIPAGETELLWGEWLRSGDVTTKNSPLWKTNVKQQLGYLQIKNWARAFAPGAILGIYTADELEDHSAAAPRDVTPSREAPKPEYSQDRFEEKLPAWRDAVEAGKTTADRIVAMLESRATITEEQRQTLLALDVVDADHEQEEPTQENEE